MLNMRSNPDWSDLDDPFLLDDDDIAFCHLTLEQYLEQHDLYEHDDP